MRVWLVIFSVILLSQVNLMAQVDPNFVPPPKANHLRIATYNVSLHRTRAGELVENLKADDKQASKIARIIQLTSPDILLVNEIDFDENGEAAKLFLEKYLQVPQQDSVLDASRLLKYYFTSEVNTGQPSGLDLNKNGKVNEPDDCWGFGLYPGQYGMAVYSRFPIVSEEVRTFRKFLWRNMPGALSPTNPLDQKPFYSPEAWNQFPLSSKSHWDIPIKTELGVVHVLASHPTPPVFDGREDRNGSRNHDEIRFWKDYISGEDASNYITDDQGKSGGLPTKAAFVVMGDLNSDPFDGDGRSEAIKSLLESKRITSSPVPQSQGGVLATKQQGKANQQHKGPAENDTADFGDSTAGNLRCDFVLPSQYLEIVQSGVFWPTAEQLADAEELISASDHRLVWIDVQIRKQEPPRP
jgi:Endonuclease/Exonuclease/phosphatase family